MSPPGGSGASGVRAVLAVLAASGCATVALTPGLALAQGPELEKVQEQELQACLLMNGGPECIGGRRRAP